MVDLKQLMGKIVEGDVQNAVALVKTALAEDVKPHEILEQGLLPGMAVVGEKFKLSEMFIPEVLMSAQAMAEAMSALEPALGGSKEEIFGRAALGTVKDDIHSIGKDLVIIMLKGVGFKVIDLGVDVPAEKFVEVAKRGEVELIGMSAMLTTTAPYMGTVIQALKEANIRSRVKVMVGGAVVTPDFAQEIGADAYEPNAFAAAERAKVLLGRLGV